MCKNATKEDGGSVPSTDKNHQLLISSNSKYRSSYISSWTFQHFEQKLGKIVAFLPLARDSEEINQEF